MASVDGVERQRPALPSIIHLDLDKPKVERQESRFPPINTINTSAAPMGSPNTMYSGPPPPYTYASITNGSSQPGYISPPESTTRRSTREEEKTSPRKSLPSIQEALADSKGLPPLSATSHQSSLPTPSTTLSQHFPEAPKGPSNPFSAPTFRDNPFSLNSSTSSIPPDLRSKEFLSAPPPQSPRSAIPPSFHSGPTVAANSTFGPRHEPSQIPRSPDIDHSQHSYQTLTRPSFPSGYREDSFQFSGSSLGHESRHSYNRPDGPYESTVKRHIGVHEAEADLTEVQEISRRNADITNNWAQRYHQGNRSGFFQDSLPSTGEIDEMMRNSQIMVDNLARLKEVVVQQQNALSEHRARFARGAVEEEYHPRQDSYDPNGFAAADAKKRRGKAAPPGRCHSCNRAETPEWRRGPDGARTLCNACGLHYAKLTRKMGSKVAQIRGSDIRPKNLDMHP